MRPTTSALVLAAVLPLAGCGDDGDEPADQLTGEPPVAVAGDTTSAADTVPGGEATAPGSPGDVAAGERSDAAGGDGSEASAGAEAGERSAAAGQAGQSGAGEAARGQDGERLYTTQVAAFESPDSAQKWTDRLSSLDLPTWTSIAELEGRTFYRVRVGAVSNVRDARRLGALLTDRFEWPVWVAPVTASDPVPDGAMASTRRVLGDE